MKRFLSMLLTVAIIIGMVPAALAGTAHAATTETGTFFIFPTEKYDVKSPKVVNSERLDVTGSINGVNGESISYSVFQLTKDSSDKTTVINSATGQSGNIVLNGNQITVTGIKLYSGLNRITFQGKQGSSTVQDSFYVEYRNGPTLYDLKASLAGQTVELPEKSTAVLMAEPGGYDYGKATATIIVTGVAPSATKVTVSANGKDWTYNVSSYNDYKFSASNVIINQGKNLVTIRVFNGDQSVETTREITFYNGKPTFYDTFLTKGTTTSADLSGSPDFSVSDVNGINLRGKALVPFEGATAPTSVKINYTFNGGAKGTGSITVPDANLQKYTNYVIVPFEISLPGTPEFDNKISTSLSIEGQTGELSLYYTLRNSAQAYINDVNYLQGYNTNTVTSEALNLTGASMKNTTTNIYSLPAGLEVIAVNDSGSLTVGTDIGNSEVVASQNVQRTINGQSMTVKKYVLKISQLPTEGTQTIKVQLKNGGTVINEIPLSVTMLYGPYVQFNKAYDGQKISIDTASATQAQTKKLEAVDHFAGQLFNVPNLSDITYTGTNRTVSLYINNVLVDLQKKESVDKFTLTDASKTKAADALVPGVNTIKFVYKSSKSSYEKTFKINVAPTNIPVIPVDGSLGVIPFSYDSSKHNGTPKYSDIAPKVIDSKFVKGDTKYSTTESKMNIFGTFDFVDLGTNKDNVQAAVKDLGDKKNDYILSIQSSYDSKSYEWSLADAFYSDDSSKILYNTSSTGDLIVYYHPKEENFSFVLRGQDVPSDGSSAVYNITLYNSGKGGPSATFRVEVVYATTPFAILAPIPEKRTINQNFVQVVVSAAGATGVTINKQAAEKITFDGDLSGNHTVDAYSTTVTGLKANKDNKIDITVTIGTQTLKDSITVKYVPTNIPGAGYMEAMKKSHKVFDGALTLAFDKDTSLIRPDFDLPESYKNQVFSGHNLLFAIANSEDGVVDRKEFILDFADFNKLVQSGAQYFVGNYPQKFSKSSPVFWIDPGEADDINTDKAYDPVKDGQDPYQLSSYAPTKSFYMRDFRNELIPSKRATLTLTYNANVAQDAGKLITAFRFNPELLQWENIGGIVDAKKHTIKVPFDRFGYYVVGKLGETYTDIIDHPYGRDYIEAIFAKGVMNPFDAATRFAPDLNITRGEFTQAIVKAQQLRLNYGGKSKSFDDTGSISNANADALYDFRYIETAARAGLVKGVQPRSFQPTNNITRQDASVIIAKALNLKLDTDRAKITKGLQKYFKDYASIDYYAQASVLAIAKKNFISGAPIDAADPKKGYMFNPTSFMLRGDAAIIIAKVMADQKKLPKI